MIQKSEQSKVFKIYEHQVSGKTAKLVTADNTKILKGLDPHEKQFYQYAKLNQWGQFKHIKRFMPQMFGTLELQIQPQISANQNNAQLIQWLKHLKDRYPVRNSDNQFIILQNMINGYNYPNILDIKLGNRKQKPQKILKSVAAYKLKLNGMSKSSQNIQQQFRSKYGLNKISDMDQIMQNLGYFFQIKGIIQIQLVINVIDKLKDLVIAVRSLSRWQFVSTSVCIFYDASCPQKYRVSFIDFGRVKEVMDIGKYDNDTSLGLQNIINFLLKIVQNPQKFNNKIPRKPSTIIPEQKIKKFQKLRNQSQISNGDEVKDS